MRDQDREAAPRYRFAHPGHALPVSVHRICRSLERGGRLSGYPSRSPRKRYHFFDGLQGFKVCTIAVRLLPGERACLTGMNLPVIADLPICLFFIATTSFPGRLASFVTRLTAQSASMVRRV